MDPTLSVDDAEFRHQIAQSYWQLLAMRPTDAEIDRLTQLWEAISSLDGPENAWQGLLSALLQDPWFLTY